MRLNVFIVARCFLLFARCLLLFALTSNQQKVKSNKQRVKCTEQQAKTNEQWTKLTSNKRKLTSNEQKLRSIEQKPISNEQKLMSNEQRTKSSASKYIYPKYLELKLEHQGEDAKLLDLDIKLEDIFVYKFFEKKCKFPFFILRILICWAIFHHQYSIIYSEFLWITFWLTLTDFVPKASQLYSK